ncbi:hypothetical protein AB9K26_14535 [Psychroserpens sp. XS_ASV72]|uniref:hypothetical protein n=1 Tax=Psychroserpens sp. XS_ASV72 TaxID=3241293 RepID=UPI003513FD4F
MEKSCINDIVLKYLNAKILILNRGYSREIDWQDNLDIDFICESTFLREAAWVILSSGMKESVIQKIFPSISASFFNWKNTKKIISQKNHCLESAKKNFNNEKKLNAIIEIAEQINRLGFESIINSIKEEEVDYIKKFPFMGPATAFHFAKNIGLDVAKPDRHLIRIADVLGYQCPQKLCYDISGITDEKLSVVDLVLWRFAVLERDYLNFFKS